MTTGSEHRADAPGEPTDIVEGASVESFPASDPPAWTPINGERSPPNLVDQDQHATGGETVPESLDGSQAELAEVKDRLLRALADQENFRRRAERDREDAVRFAATQLVKDLLPTADSLSRALESVLPGQPAQDEALQNLSAGVAATERALRDAFLKHGIKKIQPAPCEPFDPNRHQALFEVEGSDCPDGTVAQILLPGYAYHERLLRPALIGVAKSHAAPTPDRPG